MTIRIFDMALDEMRDATQEDVDKLIRIANAYGMLRSFLSDQMGLIASVEEEAYRVVTGTKRDEPKAHDNAQRLYNYMAAVLWTDRDEISPFVAQ